ncbi:hypothetical protein GC176_00175 [bacterium]|nr:hypothetical protein [bacterium]
MTGIRRRRAVREGNCRSRTIAEHEQVAAQGRTDGGRVDRRNRRRAAAAGARPSVGKSAFCGTLALAAAAAGFPTLFLSYEMSWREMTGRFRDQ